jgi:uncharacterized GH25 family protein
MRFLLIAMLAAAAAFAQAVEVTVVNSDDGSPIAGVKVELAQKESAARQGSTDAQGVFRFEAVAEGEYSVELTKSGYRHLNRSRRWIHVAAGGDPVRVEERMLRQGQLSGKVTGAGKPVAGADLQLLLLGNFIGQVQRTDAKGEFRFQGVDPGTYILSARATRSSSPSPDQDGRRMGFVRTWYPSLPDASAAAKIVVSPGADLFGQDIELRAVPVHRVSGRVLSVNGEPAGGISVKAAPPEEFAVAEFELATKSGDDGVFEFDGLPDGNWRITAEAKADGEGLYAGLWETVAGRDLERLELRFALPIVLSGKVVRAATGAPAERQPLGVMLAPREGGSRLSFSAVKADGSFRIENLVPGSYRFQPTSPGAPYYLASIEMNGRDVTGEWVEILPGTLPVTITYRADGGTVRGSVEDCGSATVVLAPRDASLQYAEFIRQERCSQNGRFEITGVRPGEYYAFAFDKGVGMLELSTFVGRSINQAVRVTVRAGEATDASLKVTQREIY